jgi:hypothetical protein
MAIKFDESVYEANEIVRQRRRKEREERTVDEWIAIEAELLRGKRLGDAVRILWLEDYDALIKKARRLGEASGDARRKPLEVLHPLWLDSAVTMRKRNPDISVPNIAKRIVAIVKESESDYGFIAFRDQGTIENYLYKNLKK